MGNCNFFFSLMEIIEKVEDIDDIRILPFEKRIIIALKLHLLSKKSQRETCEMTGVDRKVLRR